MSNSLGSLWVDLGVRTHMLDIAERRLRFFAMRANRELGLVQMSVFSLNRAFVALGGAIVANQYVEMADKLRLLRARMRIVTDETKRMNDVQNQLLEIANESRVSYEMVATLYYRMARGAKELGVSYEDLMTVTKAISKLITISGANAREALFALIQFSQGLQQGALYGDELRSVMEQLPAVLMKVAKGMGVSWKQIARWRKEGTARDFLTTKNIIEALKATVAETNKEFEQIPLTVGQSLIIAQNEIMRFIWVLETTIGPAEKLAGAVRFLSDSLKELSESKSFLMTMEALAMILDLLVEPFYGFYKGVVGFSKELNNARDKMGKLNSKLAPAEELFRTLIDVGWKLAAVLRYLGRVIGALVASASNFIASPFNTMIKMITLGYKMLQELINVRLRVEFDPFPKLKYDKEALNRLEQYWNDFKNVYTQGSKDFLAGADAYRKEAVNAWEELMNALSGPPETLTDRYAKERGFKKGGKKGGTEPPVSEDYLEALRKLRLELELIGKSEPEKRARIIAEKLKIKIDSKEYREIFNLTTAIYNKQEEIKKAEEERLERERELKRLNEDLSGVMDDLLSKEEMIAKVAERRMDIVLRAAEEGLISDERAAELIVKIHEKKNKELQELYMGTFNFIVDMNRRMVERLETTFSSMFIDTIKGKLNSFKDFFQRFMDAILQAWSDVMAQMVVRDMFGKQFISGQSSQIGGWLGALFGGLFAEGGVFRDGKLVKFARGGVVNRPTIFPMADGMGLMGEAGPEAVMPLTRTSTGELGVKAVLDEGGRKEEVGVVNLTIYAVDAQSVVDLMKKNPEAVVGPLLDELYGGNVALRTALRRVG